MMSGWGVGKGLLGRGCSEQDVKRDVCIILGLFVEACWYVVYIDTPIGSDQDLMRSHLRP